jgi:hypothetical protein
MLKSKIMCFVFVIILSITTTAFSEESFSLGGGQIYGHSYSGDYAVERGYGIVGSWQKYKRARLLYFSYGISGYGISWQRKDNEKDQKITDEYSTYAIINGSMYLNLKYIYPFVRIGAGNEFSTDATADVAGMVGYGIDIPINKTWSIEVLSSKLFTEERRHGLDSISLKIRF